MSGEAQSQLEVVVSEDSLLVSENRIRELGMETRQSSRIGAALHKRYLNRLCRVG